jgi:hypothetical protein
MVAHIIALRTNLGRYLTGMSEVAENLDYGFQWWWVDRPAANEIFWFSPNLVWITGSVAFAVFLVSLWKLRAEIGLPGYNADWAKEIHLSDSSELASEKSKSKGSMKTLFPKLIKPRK